jgi:hypothetical protein
VRYRAQGKTHRYGPTLIGRADLESDLEMDLEIRAENPKRANWYATDIKEMRRVLSLMDSGSEIVVGRDWENGTPSIYINKDAFNRSDAERMIGAMMKHLRVANFYFQWERKTEIVVCPISIPPKRLREAAV